MTVPVPVNTKENTSGPTQGRPLGTVPRIHGAALAESAVLTVYPVKKELIVNRGDTESRYDVPEGFEILHLDLEQMFDVALTNTGIDPENTWWELGFVPADEINEYTARRMTFTVRPGHNRPPHGIWMVFEEDGMTTEHGHRPDLDWPEWRGGVGTGPCELKALI